MNRNLLRIAASLAAGAICLTLMLAQEPGGGGGGKGGGKNKGPAQMWYVEKTKGGVYTPPNRPLWKLSELKQMHAGQPSWQEQIILDPEQDAIYYGGAPGTKYTARMHPDTPSVFVVVAGNVLFDVEGQPQTDGHRGSIINIMKSTVYSYEVTGTEPAYFIEVNPTNYKTVYPVSGPAPKAAKAGGEIIRIGFNHTPAPYTPGNQLHFNTFDDLIGKCGPTGAKVVDDHLFANPLLGYVNTADNKCGTGNGNIGQGPAQAGAPPFNAKTTFGHMHAGPAEWWIVQVGQISGKFENAGEFIGTEGDVLYAAPMSWHQMSAQALSGPNVRLAMGGYNLINMQNTAGGAQ